MATISHLPPELLAIIFLYVNERLPGHSATTPSRRRSFPFNAASVCNFWLNILKSQPQYWSHIQIDLADDPTPFLDTFSLFNAKGGQAPLSITVFSTDQDSLTLNENSKEERAWVSREGHRARKVFKHLKPSLTLYENVTFDVIYQSSLPSATKFLTVDLPFLARLSLDCQVHNLDEGEIHINFSRRSFPLCGTIPCLVSLSLTGRSFMELYLLGTDWLDGFKNQLTAGFELDVTHFIFSELEAGKNCNGSRALTTFAKMLNNTPSLLKYIYLSDLDVDFDPPSSYKNELNVRAQTLNFDGVSSNFLSAFLGCCWIGDAGMETDLIFTRCEIPDYRDKLMSLPNSLELVDIPFQTDNNSPYNALRGYPSEQIFFTGCAGVTDDLLDWLSTSDDSTSPDNIPSQRMKSLTIADCGGFTVGALRSFIMKRAAIFPSDATINLHTIDLISGRPLRKIKVIGSCPPLSLDEAAWFLDKDRVPTCDVEWDVEGEYGEGFVTKLNTASA